MPSQGSCQIRSSGPSLPSSLSPPPHAAYVLQRTVLSSPCRHLPFPDRLPIRALARTATSPTMSVVGSTLPALNGLTFLKGGPLTIGPPAAGDPIKRAFVLEWVSGWATMPRTMPPGDLIGTVGDAGVHSMQFGTRRTSTPLPMNVLLTSASTHCAAAVHPPQVLGDVVPPLPQLHTGEIEYRGTCS